MKYIRAHYFERLLPQTRAGTALVFPPLPPDRQRCPEPKAAWWCLDVESHSRLLLLFVLGRDVDCWSPALELKWNLTGWWGETGIKQLYSAIKPGKWSLRKTDAHGWIFFSITSFTRLPEHAQGCLHWNGFCHLHFIFVHLRFWTHFCSPRSPPAHFAGLLKSWPCATKCERDNLHPSRRLRFSLQMSNSIFPIPIKIVFFHHHHHLHCLREAVKKKTG